MVSDMITAKKAYLRTWWGKLPYGIKHSIKNAIEEGKWWIDVVKSVGPDGKKEVNESILHALEDLGYMVYYTDDESMNTYRISWFHGNKIGA